MPTGSDRPDHGSDMPSGSDTPDRGSDMHSGSGSGSDILFLFFFVFQEIIKFPIFLSQ